MKEPPEYDAQKNVIEDDKFFRFGNSHPTRTWQEEFNERFGFYCGKPKNETMTPNNVRAFISSLLSRQESEVRTQTIKECLDSLENDGIIIYSKVKDIEQYDKRWKAGFERAIKLLEALHT